MPEPREHDRDTFTRIMVALAVNDGTDDPLSALEIEQIADELLEWGHQLRDEFRRAEIADRVAKLSRAEVEARLATRLVPTACCTQRAPANDADPTTLSDDDLREQLVEAEAFVARAA